MGARTPPSSLSLAALRAFAQIVETGSVTRAAEALGISQGAVSQHLKTIETHAQRKLFVRVGQRLKPNEDGELVYLDVRDALELLASAERRLSPASEQTIILGIQYSFGFHTIAPLVTEIRQAFPDLDLSLEMLSEEPGPHNRHIDLYLSSWTPGGDFHAIRTLPTHWRPYAHPDLALPADWQDSDTPLISFENGMDWRNWGLTADLPAKRMIETDSAGLAAELAIQKAGIAICADLMVATAMRDGALRPLSDRSALLEWGQVSFALNHHTPNRSQAEALADWMSARLEHLARNELKRCQTG